jgi:hypothetical protein
MVMVVKVVASTHVTFTSPWALLCFSCVSASRSLTLVRLYIVSLAEDAGSIE